jgi:hypothetical protein
MQKFVHVHALDQRCCAFFGSDKIKRQQEKEAAKDRPWKQIQNWDRHRLRRRCKCGDGHRLIPQASRACPIVIDRAPKCNWRPGPTRTKIGFLATGILRRLARVWREFDLMLLATGVSRLCPVDGVNLLVWLRTVRDNGGPATDIPGKITVRKAPPLMWTISYREAKVGADG